MAAVVGLMTLAGRLLPDVGYGAGVDRIKVILGKQTLCRTGCGKSCRLDECCAGQGDGNCAACRFDRNGE
jgi:hypothetical protein